MANVFNRYTATGIGTSPVTVRTATNPTTVIGLLVTNTTGSQIEVTVTVAGVRVGVDVPIPAGSALDYINGKMVITNGDTVTVVSNTANSAEILLSVLEQT